MVTPKNTQLRHAATKVESSNRTGSIQVKSPFYGKAFSNEEKQDYSSDDSETEEDIKYNSKNIEKGKPYFRNRYIKDKLKEIDLTIKRISNSGNVIKINEGERLFRTSFPILKSSNNKYETESEKRKCKTEFLLIVEKAIISFNLKKFQESYTYLESSGVIKKLEEFGKFLLIASGFDKFILGEFLAKEKPPNDKSEVLNSFINSIDMNYKQYSFLDCLRFLLTRLILPKDANLILVIMDKFSQHFYESNKEDKEFVKIFKNTNAIYLLVSTILALNTMFTRKDIKNMNVIKKDEFKSMNKDIDPTYINKLYDELKKNPISLSDDYYEEIYKKLTPLVLINTKDINSKDLETLKKGFSSDNLDKKETQNNTKNSNENKDNKKEENNENKKEIENKKEYELKKINSEKLMEQKYYEMIQDFMDLDIVRKTLRGNYYRKKSFSMNTNLLVFTDMDKKLLRTPNKFYLIQGSSKPLLREFLVYDEFKKLTFDKTIDVNKQKYKKFIEINDINDVILGIKHGENIKKYIKAYPQEEKLANNFISIVYNNYKEQIDIKNDDLSVVLFWFKAMKSLIIQTKTKGEKEKFSQGINKINHIREKISKIWEEHILTHWNNYAKYIILRIYEKNNYFKSILTQPERQAKYDLLDERKILNDKTIEEFLKDISDRFTKNPNNTKLEYYEFFCLCYLGFPQKIRNNMWKICIENNLGLTKNLYLEFKKEIIKEKYDFNEFDFNYRENPNVQFNPNYNLNLIIIDILKIRYIFLQELNERNITDSSLNELMQKVYNITIIFKLIRNDIPYNKGIVSIVYFFLLAGLDEVSCFICISNLICSKYTINLFLGDKDTIKSCVNFFGKKILKGYSEKVYEHLKKLEISPELYLIPWFEKFFTHTLDFNILLHIFDLYLINGEYILYQTAITIIKLVEEDLYNLTISEVFKMLKILPKKYTELDFFQKFKTFNCIRDEYIAWNKNNILSLEQKEIEEVIKK